MSTQVLPPLGTVAAGVETVVRSLAAADLQHARNTLADRIWLGVLCLQASEHHRLPVGRPKKLSRRDNFEPTSLIVHPQGFQSWLAVALPDISRPAAYKYMDAAKGIGLDAYSSEDEARALVAQRLSEFDARQQQLTLGALAEQGKLVGAGEPEPKTPAKRPSLEEIKTETIQTMFTFMEELDRVREAMTPVEQDTVVNRLAQMLQRLTGQEWSPAS